VCYRRRVVEIGRKKSKTLIIVTDNEGNSYPNFIGFLGYFK
jgi:hypothetical protein